MARKTGLTRDQHVELGQELATMRDRLGDITVELSKAYPQKVANLAHRAQDSVDELRSSLDSIVFAEHPSESLKDDAGVYYGSRE